eukprot:TRINITY_DN26200_c1_g1_i2.p1 TRINITY_DN26200_c1_g1~~TRINITY_DN26200_c1_g1_i2.p1  ORF type:complete len:320 (-),score=34.73 TRINITY_DN26200_c1_g1_i2:248-1147(-)
MRLRSSAGSPANSGRGLVLEPDSRHAEAIVRDLGIETAKGVETPREKPSAEQQVTDAGSPALDKERAKLFRSLTMRAAYLAQDRADINETTKTLARSMQAPNEAAFQKLRRLGRYLQRYPQLPVVCQQQGLPTKLNVFVDSVHAGCAVTRRSTTGMATRFGMHTVKHSTNLQSTIALSSGESEYYALVKGAAIGLGMQSLLCDWGLDVAVEVLSDSSAARGHVSRRGLGRMRHIQSRFLWIQERAADGHVKISAVPGKQNPSDILTEAVSGQSLLQHLTVLGFEWDVQKSTLQRATAHS